MTSVKHSIAYDTLALFANCLLLESQERFLPGSRIILRTESTVILPSATSDWVYIQAGVPQG